MTQESIAKEREDRKEPLGENEAVMGDETSLFYSDIMPLLVSVSDITAHQHIMVNLF